MSDGCIKCGSASISVRYHKDGHSCLYSQRREEGFGCCNQPEHLHKTCGGCGFSWRDPVLDGEGEA